jgi:hypothetical protein
VKLQVEKDDLNRADSLERKQGLSADMFESVKKKIRVHPFLKKYHFGQIESRL